MAKNDGNNADLGRLFAEARHGGHGAGKLPQGLSQRILADAGQVQAGFDAAVAIQPLVGKPGRWAHLLAALGGWPALGGLATASAAGIWIGLAPPSFLPDPAGLVMGAETGADADIDLIGLGDLFAAMSEDG